jgi:class 3 adenylate cyclase
MRFCGMCGMSLSSVCRNCNFINPLGFRFCGNCGTKLIDTANDVTNAPSSRHPLIPSSESSQPSHSTSASILEGERRFATVVMTDLQGSTELLEKLGTEAWVELMNRALQVLETEVHRFGGEVEQFRGDGMVAFFGASQMHEDDPERAVLAALSMQRALQSFAVRENIELKLRVGVNTGEVIVDTSATRRPYSETAMGIAVTIASRMENSAEPGSVLVSEYTHRYVESQFDWQPLGNFNVRGISQPIAVFRPLAPKAETEHERTSDSPFPAYRIGRDAEFLALKECVEGALSGRGRIVLLTGDKGLGKSSLVNDLREYYAHRSELLKFAETDGEKKSLTWLRGRCRSYHQNYPFAMWIDLLQNWLNAQQLSSKEETRDRLREKCIDLWGDGFVEHYAFLAALLRLAVESPYDEQTRYLDAGGLNERSFIAVRSWIEAMC